MILWPWFVLVVAYGACVGSFLNVVIYRLPDGRSIISPPSSCPKCGHGLAWHDNVPILGWLWLRGRCRYCGNPISIQYPLIEASCAALFGWLFCAYYVWPINPNFFFSVPLPMPKDFFFYGFAATWPVFLVHLVLVASLLAATMIDAKFYLIPMEIPWTATAVALIVLPIAAWFMPDIRWVSPYIDITDPHLSHWFWLALGGLGGLGLSVLFLRLGVLPRSFDDDPAGHDAGPDGPPALAVAEAGQQEHEADVPSPEEDFLAYPHARREVLKECLFLLPPVLGAMLGWWAGAAIRLPAGGPAANAMGVLGGVIMGYLVGGATVWLTRILGTLAFGKEAMGLGDVHLMGAIGAVLGGQVAVVSFFVAPFFGLGYVLLAVGLRAVFKGKTRIIPYGPFLAAAAVVMMVTGQVVLRFFQWP